jgi:predicted ATPase
VSVVEGAQDRLSDVFISYAHETAPQARAAADALRTAGYSVWLDEDMPVHRAFSPEIDAQLTAAKAALVIWSADAAVSDWVLSEANRAREDRKLVQLRLDGARLPMPFDQVQCADLTGWTGDSSHPRWAKVVSSVAELVGRPPASPAPVAAPREVGTDNLPKRLPSLIGRVPDLEALEGLLARADLVTLTGAGGVGKTRLAVEAARRTAGEYEDGSWLIELAPVTEASQVPAAVARAMAIELMVGRDPFEALIDRLRLRRCLILLDNCEHLVDAVATLAEAILEASNSVKLLVSSQEPLGVEREQVYRVRSLADVDAAALFTERAGGADASFVVQARDEAAVAAICARLDGIPLAIEMAAARAPSLGCKGVLERLDDRFRLLTGGRRTALPRQRTLAATLDWSHGLLSERDATVFRRLGAFSGGFTLAAASKVATGHDLDGLDVVDAISSLVAKSLVVADPGAERPRYRLLETTRAYTLEKLNAAGETHDIQRRHAEWCLAFTRTVQADYVGRVSDETFAARYFGENDNLERALDWCFAPDGDAQLGVAIVSFGEPMWVCQSLYGAYTGWLERATPHVGEATPLSVRVRLLSAISQTLLNTAPVQALGMVDEVIEAARELGDPIELAGVLNAKGYALWALNRGAEALELAEAVELAEESIRIVAALPPGRVSALSKCLAATLCIATGEDAAIPRFREAIDDLRAFGADGLANFIEQDLLYMAPMTPDAVVDFCRRSLARVRPGQMLADYGMSMAVHHLLFALAERGEPSDLDEAIDVYRRHYRRLMPGMGRSFATGAMAKVVLRQGRLREAAMLLAYSTAAVGQNAWYRGDPASLRDALRRAVAPGDLDAWMAAGARLSEEEALKLPLDESASPAVASNAP